MLKQKSRLHTCCGLKTYGLDVRDVWSKKARELAIWCKVMSVLHEHTEWHNIAIYSLEFKLFKKLPGMWGQMKTMNLV